MSMVHTTKGPIERERLTVRERCVEENDQVRVIAMEWFLGDECVRRDGWAVALRGLEVGAHGG